MRTTLDELCAAVGIKRLDGETDAELWQRGHDKAMEDFHTLTLKAITAITSELREYK